MAGDGSWGAEEEDAKYHKHKKEWLLSLDSQHIILKDVIERVLVGKWSFTSKKWKEKGMPTTAYQPLF